MLWTLLLMLAAEPLEFRVAVAVEVEDEIVSAETITEMAGAKVGEFEGVKVIPDGRVKDAVMSARADINAQCKAGALDQACQISLGNDLGATYWLRVRIERSGTSCDVRLSALNISQMVQEASTYADEVPCRRMSWSRSRTRPPRCGGCRSSQVTRGGAWSMPTNARCACCPVSALLGSGRGSS